MKEKEIQTATFWLLIRRLNRSNMTENYEKNQRERVRECEMYWGCTGCVNCMEQPFYRRVCYCQEHIVFKDGNN